MKRKYILFISLFLVALLLTNAFFIAYQTKNASLQYPKLPTIAIDAGHGGIDRGASGFGLYESDINLQISSELETCLSTLGYPVCMTRTGDYGLYGDTSYGFKKRDMQARKQICENAFATATISIHTNSSTLQDRTGVVLYYNSENSESTTLANSIASFLPNCKLQTAELFMTHKLNMPSVLIECGFISTKSEAAKLNSQSYQKEIATNIAKGILLYLKEQE